jgi:5-methylcytosine-specific restriction protein A
MNNETVKFVIHQVSDRIGLAITGKLSQSAEGQTCECAPLDGHPNESFAIRFNLNWRSADAVFVPGQFSAALIQQMGNATAEGRQIFSSFAKALEVKRIKVQMRVNGGEINPAVTAGWPALWNRLELSLRTPPLVIEQNDEALSEQLVLQLIVPFFGMMAALIGVEENEPETAGEIEGAAIQTIGIRYERKKVNREACIQLKGSRCFACGFDFAETYGPIGIGYIEVHHVKPLATLGADYRLNIETDLVPFCANCHAMAHREEPPISPDRLRQLVDERRKAAAAIK